MINFDVAFNYLINFDEGSKYTNDPDDPGGPTKYGITKKTYQDFFNCVVLDSEIENMTALTAKQVYNTLYWARLSCPKMQNLAIAICLFDSGVLYGIGTVGLMAQEILSTLGADLKLDGILGDRSIGFLNMARGETFIEAFREKLYDHIDKVIAHNPKESKYRHGWSLRADRLLNLLDDSFLNKLKGE